MMSGELSVGFLRRGVTWAILKPVVRDELMRKVRNWRRSPEMV